MEKNDMASLLKRVKEEGLPKPKVRLVREPEPQEALTIDLSGPDGNVFAVIGMVSTLLRRAGQRETAEEFKAKAFACDSYEAVLALVKEYVKIVE